MSNLSTEDKDLLERLRKVSPLKRRKLLTEADSLDTHDAARRAERLRRLRRAVELWPLSNEETRALMAEIEAAREVVE